MGILIVIGLTSLSGFAPHIEEYMKPKTTAQPTAIATTTQMVTVKPSAKAKDSNPASQIQQKSLPILNGGVIFSLINNYRASLGKPFLSVSSELCAFAEQRADYMMQNNMEAFKSSDTGNHTGLSNISSQYSGEMIGENLGANLGSDTSVLNIWKNSPPHNELMLVTEKDGILMTKGCIATRVSEIGSITVLLVGDK